MTVKSDVDAEIYYSQKELAARWKVSESTVKSWREKGIIPFFQLPLTSRILYPVRAILELEKNNLHIREEKKKQKITQSKREKSVISTKSNRKWKI